MWSRMQVAGDTINFQVSDTSTSQYVGPWNTKEWAWDQTTFVPMPGKQVSCFKSRSVVC